MKKIEIKSINVFVEAIKKVGRTPSTENYFRGHASDSYNLIPSIYRENSIDYEDRLFREMVLRVPHEFAGYKSAIEHLVKMQHYGLPTRLLDITLNPLVALYFACTDLKNTEDGE